MKILGFLAATVLTGLCLVPAAAAPEYVRNIENPSTVSYTVEVHDKTRVRGVTLAPGKTASMTLDMQTPKVSVTGTGCTASATPSIRTYVTLALRAGCKIETKAAGVSGF
jgi:hypothetical protein